ncbi:MAG: leucine-rich repeat domain-containing protein, partial [Spirochaetia bacterium]|nr:leucine-rich repeat domain-containing protein [Spirochaetia bacterium]
IPKSLNYIDYCAFQNCFSLEPASIPDSLLEDSSRSAFDGCEKLNRENIFRDGIVLDPSGEFLVACLREKAGACVIPEGVRAIKNGAFRDCRKLTSIVFPQSLSSIGEEAFINCPNLDAKTLRAVKTIMEKETEALKDFLQVRAEDSYTFHADETSCDIAMYRGKGGRVEIPAVIKGQRVEYIEYRAFANQKAITSVVIPNTVSAIINNAFEGCTGLKEISIPASVQSIHDNVFEGCVNLEAIRVDPDNRWFADLDGVVYDKELAQLICYPPGRTKEFTPPPTLKGMSLAAFSTKMKLKSGERKQINEVISKLYSGCKKTGDRNAKVTYYLQTGGKWIIPSVIGEGAGELQVTEIGESVFAKSRFIPDEIEIPASVRLIRPDSFTREHRHCAEKLRAIHVHPDNPAYSCIDGVVLNKAGDTLVCFPGGKGGDYVIPESVKKLETGVFLCCDNLASITIQENLREIPGGTIAVNPKLKNIIVSPENPDFKSMDGVLFRKDGAVLVAFPAGRKGEYQIPQGVTVIDSTAFGGCMRLTSIIIPEGVREIRSEAFVGCAGLVAIQFPQSLVSIGDSAFDHCAKLKTLNLPPGLQHIGENVFCECDSLLKKTRNLIRERFGKTSLDSLDPFGFDED